jgi:hypothetical protein
LIRYTPRAARQIADLRQHHEARDRLTAIRALAAAPDEAEAQFGRGAEGPAATLDMDQDIV